MIKAKSTIRTTLALSPETREQMERLAAAMDVGMTTVIARAISVLHDSYYPAGAAKTTIVEVEG